VLEAALALSAAAEAVSFVDWTKCSALA